MFRKKKKKNTVLLLGAPGTFYPEFQPTLRFSEFSCGHFVSRQQAERGLEAAFLNFSIRDD